MVVIIITVIITTKTESFDSLHKDTEFKGMNLLGLNSVDTFIPASSVEECKNYCLGNDSCKGFSYYWPGQRCLIFSSGGFVPNRPGFISGMVN
jgi:hypothetical protein